MSEQPNKESPGDFPRHTCSKPTNTVINSENIFRFHSSVLNGSKIINDKRDFSKFKNLAQSIIENKNNLSSKDIKNRLKKLPLKIKMQPKNNKLTIEELMLRMEGLEKELQALKKENEILKKQNKITSCFEHENRFQALDHDMEIPNNTEEKSTTRPHKREKPEESVIEPNETTQKHKKPKANHLDKPPTTQPGTSRQTTIAPPTVSTQLNGTNTRPQIGNQRISTIANSDQTRTPQTTSKPPPIKINNNNSTYIIRLLKETFNYKNFTIHKTNRFESSLTLENMDTYEKVIEDLKNKQINFFTYTPKSEKVQSYILKGLAVDSDLDEIKEELESLKNIKFVKIERFTTTRSKNNNTTLPLLLVQIDAASKPSDLYKIKTVYYQKISWEKLIKKDISQCRNCQMIGHVASNCNMPYQCVKCKEGHGPGECGLKNDTLNSQLFCILCQKYGHPASYQGCPKIKEIKKKIQEKKNEKSEATKNKIQNVYSLVNKKVQYSQVAQKSETPSQANKVAIENPINKQDDLILSRLQQIDDHITKMLSIITKHDNQIVCILNSLN